MHALLTVKSKNNYIRILDAKSKATVAAMAINSGVDLG
jgi:hypothetical protein